MSEKKSAFDVVTSDDYIEKTYGKEYADLLKQLDKYDDNLDKCREKNCKNINDTYTKERKKFFKERKKVCGSYSNISKDATQMNKHFDCVGDLPESITKMREDVRVCTRKNCKSLMKMIEKLNKQERKILEERNKRMTRGKKVVLPKNPLQALAPNIPFLNLMGYK